jgi:hypothetical protein
MTKEQKEELVKMTWEKVLKESRKDRNRNVFSQRTQDDVRRTKLVGGKDEDKFGRIQDVKEESLDDDSYEKELAEMTRDDLLDAFIDAIDELSQDELIAILVKTQGDIKLAPKF